MKSYLIQLESLQDLEKYLYMIEHFNFQGFVRADTAIIEPTDLLSLLSIWPLHRFSLLVSTDNPQELIPINDYLESSGLLTA